jgi:hypothetical protein
VRPRDETGSISLYLLGLAVIAMTLVAGTVTVTTAHLARIRLLDVADGAALEAANALDASAYTRGVGDAVPLSDASVRRRAAEYVGALDRPPGVTAWRLGPRTGSPDGRSAVVGLSGEVELPLVGGALRDLGATITVSVVSTARADVDG